MSFPSGASFGTYRIISVIGAGGMSEVYRAHDSRLHREVAINVAGAAAVSRTMVRNGRGRQSGRGAKSRCD